MKQPEPRQSPLPRVAMKSAVIAGLVAIIAVVGAFSAVAATRTVETSATLEMEFWVSLANRSAFVSTRQEGHEWITHDFVVPLRDYPGVPNLLVRWHEGRSPPQGDTRPRNSGLDWASSGSAEP